jgi:hypothetical protein
MFDDNSSSNSDNSNRKKKYMLVKGLWVLLTIIWPYKAKGNVIDQQEKLGKVNRIWS